MAYRDIVLEDNPEYYLTWDTQVNTPNEGDLAGLTHIGGTTTRTGTALTGGGAMANNGTQYRQYTMTDATIFNGAGWTVDVWFKKGSASVTDWQEIFNLFKSGDAKNEIVFYASGNGGTAPGLFYRDNAGVQTRIYSSVSVSDTNWHHMAAVKNGTTLTLYLDGVSVGSATVGASAFSGTYTLWLNAYGAGSGMENLNGSTDELAFYDTALSATRITDHYRSGMGLTEPVAVATATLSTTAKEPTEVKGSGRAASPTLDTTYQNGSLYSSTANLTVGTGTNTYDSRIVFSKSSIDPNPQTVQKATLRMVINSVTNTPTVDVYRMNNGAMAGTKVSSKVVSGAIGTVVEFDVTSLVQEAYTNGFSNFDIGLFGNSSTGTGIVTFESSESTNATVRPVLEVWSTAVPVGVDLTLDTPTASLQAYETITSVGVSTGIILESATASLAAVEASVDQGTGTNVDTPQISAVANDVVVSTVDSPDVYLDVATANAIVQGAEVEIGINTIVDADSNDGATLDAHDPTVEMTQGVIQDLDTPRIDITHYQVTDVNGEPVLPAESDDPYFESTMRTLTGIRRGISGGMAGDSDDTQLDQSLQYWFRFNERSGANAWDRAYLIKEDGVTKQAQATLQINNVTIGLNDGPEGRHHFYFNGDAFLEQPGEWGKDETWYSPSSLEFTFRTERKTQYLMGGSDKHYGLSSSNAAPWELWMKDGKLELRQYDWNGQIVEKTTVRGFTDLADGKWHHVVIQKSHEGSQIGGSSTFFSTEFYVDARLEVRRRVGTSPGGMPDFIGGHKGWYTGYPWAIDAPDLAKSHWFLGDMTELIFRNGRTLNDDEIALQRDNVMGILAIRPEPARATLNANNDFLAKGNKPRLLILDFGPIDGLKEPSLRKAKFTIENQARFTDSKLYYNYQQISPNFGWQDNSALMDFIGWGETEAPFFPGYVGNEHLAFKRSVYYNEAERKQYTDMITDNYRLIDLENDLNMDDYDLISIIGYPRNDWMWNGIYGSLDSQNVEPKVPMRKQLEDLMAQVRGQVTHNRKGLYITDPFSAIALGIIDDVEYVPTFKEQAFLDNRLGAITGGFDFHSLVIDPFNGANPEIPLELRSDKTDPRIFDSVLKHQASRYADTHANVRHRVRNIVEGLTTIPGWIKTDEISWWNVNPFAQPPWHLSKAYEHKPFGLEIGEEFYMEGAPVEPFFSVPDAKQLERYYGWVATPMNAIKAGVAVTTFAQSFQALPGGHGEVIDVETGEADFDQAIGNPYGDHATSIAIQPGDMWEGEVVNGKVYVNFTEAWTWVPTEQNWEPIMQLTSRGFEERTSLGYGDEFVFPDGTSWTVNNEHLKYQFSTHYGEQQGSEIQLPQTGGSGADWGWSPGGKRGGTGGSGGAGYAMQYRWRPKFQFEYIYVPSMSNRAIIWLTSDLDVSGDARISAADARVSAKANSVTVETEANTEVNLSTARVNVEAHNDANTIAPDVSVLVGTPTIMVDVEGLVAEVNLSSATITLQTPEPDPGEIFIDWSEVLVMTLPRQIETLILEDN